MKKIATTFTLLALSLGIQAQGLFGIGSQDLGKKKIERITLTVLDSLNLSPSSLIRLGVTAYDKKKAYQTTKLGGDYYLSRSFKVEVSNAKPTGYFHDELVVNAIDALIADEVKIKVSLIANPAIYEEKTLSVNYKGIAVANFSGDAGRDGTSGTFPYGVGADGSHANNNAGQGENGKDVTAEIKMITYKNKQLVLAKITAMNSMVSSYYVALLGSGKIQIDVSGGPGGSGRAGGSGNAGNKDKFIDGGRGGDGGSGADGGNSGSVKIIYDENMKGLENHIVGINNGGLGGNGGSGGAGGTGYKTGTSGKPGQRGRNGLSGRFPEISYAKLNLEVPSK